MEKENKPQECSISIDINTYSKNNTIEVDVGIIDGERTCGENNPIDTKFTFKLDEISLPEIMKVVEQQVKVSMEIFGDKYIKIKF